jgi:GNAT superfamily N-acetyltransferase
MEIRAAADQDRPAIVDLLTNSWGSTTVVGHGVRYDAAALPALLALDDGRIAGLLTYIIVVDALEVVTLDALEHGLGVGTALLDAAAGLAEDAGLARLWLVTTNDNLDALRFYQRRGLRIAAVMPGALEETRRIKPEIPEIGEYGIPLRDEITLEMRPPRRAQRR